MAYFNDIAPIKYEGTKTKNMFAFRHYNPEEVVAGKQWKNNFILPLHFGIQLQWMGQTPLGEQQWNVLGIWKVVLNLTVLTVE